jgi:AcrR family transcriptional regulator
VTDYRPTALERPKRADAQRNKQILLDAAAAVFVTSGVEAPVREIAARAGVGVATIYRHFPTRADLVVAVFRHQVMACVEAAPVLLDTAATPHAALVEWSHLFVDFLVTKHGLAGALQNDRAGFESLHGYFIDHLLPACASLLDAAVASGEIGAEVSAYELLRGIGNLSVGDDSDPNYDARRLVGLLVEGMRLHRAG